MAAKDGVADAYRAPVMDGEDGDEAGVGSADLFVVSVNKLIVLSIATMRFYEVYWFYRHWRAQQRAGARVMPFVRAIFSIFFTHSLFKRIDAAAEDEGVDARWQPSSQASLYVGLMLGGVLVAQVAGWLGFIASTLLGMAAVVPLAQAQKVANLAAGDAHGSRNSRFDAGSILAVALGLVLWGWILWSSYLVSDSAGQY